MIGFGRNFEHLQFDIGAQRRKEMVALCGDGLGGRLGQRSILLERLMVGFHVPPFFVDCGNAVVSQVEITGDQIQDTNARPDAYCPVCDCQVTLKLGQKNAHHFAHRPEDICSATQPETALHLNCKFHIYKQLITGTALSVSMSCHPPPSPVYPPPPTPISPPGMKPNPAGMPLSSRR